MYKRAAKLRAINNCKGVAENMQHVSSL